MTTKIILFMDGGVIQNVMADNENVDITLIDYDTDGAEEGVVSVFGEDAFIGGWQPNKPGGLEVNKESVDKHLEEIKSKQKKEFTCPHCETSSTVNEWDKATEEVYDDGIISILTGNLTVHICPNCKVESSGKDIHVFNEEEEE